MTKLALAPNCPIILDTLMQTRALIVERGKKLFANDILFP